MLLLLIILVYINPVLCGFKICTDSAGQHCLQQAIYIDSDCNDYNVRFVWGGGSTFVQYPAGQICVGDNCLDTNYYLYYPRKKCDLPNTGGNTGSYNLIMEDDFYNAAKFHPVSACNNCRVCDKSAWSLCIIDGPLKGEQAGLAHYNQWWSWIHVINAETPPILDLNLLRIVYIGIVIMVAAIIYIAYCINVLFLRKKVKMVKMENVNLL